MLSIGLYYQERKISVDSSYLPLGWLSPEGEFVQCSCYAHLSTAREIINMLVPEDLLCPSSKYNPEKPQPDVFLLDSGWASINIHLLGKREYCIYWNRYLTDFQKIFLKKYFENPEVPIDSFCRTRWESENEIS